MELEGSKENVLHDDFSYLGHEEKNNSQKTKTMLGREEEKTPQKDVEKPQIKKKPCSPNRRRGGKKDLQCKHTGRHREEHRRIWGLTKFPLKAQQRGESVPEGGKKASKKKGVLKEKNRHSEEDI